MKNLLQHSLLASLVGAQAASDDILMPPRHDGDLPNPASAPASTSA
ncbi:hypothetical protein [Ideonella sp. B508-1]|nr:hypothetical protein [Ideonella sp. B508-1]